MSLLALKVQLSRCTNQQDLVHLAERELADRFVHLRRRVFLLERDSEGYDNPVVRAFHDLEVPLHEAMIVDEDTWKAHCPRADHGHVLLGPLLRRERMIGALAVTRSREQGSFTQIDLTRMTQLSLFFSSRLNAIQGVCQPLLTERETEVSTLVADGLSNKEIAERLSLSVYTVKDHLKSIFRKLGIHSRTALATL